jgi:hypothetical protein
MTGCAQAAGEGVLMQRVDLKTPSQLMAFKTRLHDAAYVSGKPVGHMVRELVLDFASSESNEDVETALIFVVTQMPKLHTYEVSSQAPKVSIVLLSCLSVLSAATLTYLDINILPGGDAIFPVINLLYTLDSLFLRIMAPGEWTHSAASLISLDGLKQMYCQWEDMQPNSNFVVFLSKCWFGTGGEFELRTPKLALNSETATLLQSFFSRHNFDFIHLSMPSPALVSLASSVVNAKTLMFYNCFPPPGVLPTLPESLILYYPSTNKEDREAFWDFLARPSAAPADAKQDPPVTIEICYSNEEYFGWLEQIDVDYTVFIGRLLRVAVELYKQDIVITDGYGQNVRSLTDA